MTFACLTLLVIAPLFEYRAMARQLKAGKTKTSVWLRLAYFIVNGLLASLGSGSILNAI